MAGSPWEMLLRHLTGWAEGAAVAECSDGQLLDRFVTHREEAAFAGLLRRHGPMVLSICRRALANERDREDVFQATFLLLVQKAGSIRRRESVGSWLHGVAHRLAIRCRTQIDHRRVHERQAGLERTAAMPPPQAWEELQTLLDEAIAELPEKYRSALVLCYLEDHTHEEAARRLGCRLTTLRSRVARGRERLRIALFRRGLTLSSAAFLAALATSAAQAALPPALSSRTLTAALQFAKGDAVSTLVSTSTAALVEGGLHAMSTVRLRILLIVLLISALTLGGAGLLAHQIFGEKIPEEPAQPGGERAATPPENKPHPAVDRFGDPLPERAVARLGTVRFRMGGLVCACAWSPDGKTLAAGSANQGNDNTICLFDAATGKPMRRLGGRPSRVNRLAASPDGRLGNFISDSGRAGDVASLAFSPDGRTLASGSETNVGISLWDLDTGKMLRQFRSMTAQLIYTRSLAFTPDGKGLISAGEGSPVHLWDPATGTLIRQFKGHEQLVRCAVLSPDGQTLASAADKEIRLWEMATGKLLRRLAGQKEPIRALAFSPDGKLLASGSDDRSINSIWLWETTTGKVHHPLPEEDKISKSCVRSLAFSPDGKMLAAGYEDYTFRLWDMTTGKKLHETAEVPSITTHWEFHDGGIQCVEFSRDGKKLVLARDNQLTLLDAASGKEIVPMPAHRGGMHRVFFSPDGKRLLTINDEPGQRILEWNADTGEMIRQVPGRATLARLASFSPDRKIMVSAWSTDSLTLWDAASGKEIRTIALPRKDSESPNSVIFSPDGRLLAVEAGKGEAVWLYDAATGKQLCAVEEMGTCWGLVGASESLTFSTDGRLLAAAGYTKIHLAEVPTGRQLLRIDLPEGRRASAIAISPDGRSLATPCYNFAQVTLPSMTLWESASGKERLALPTSQSQIYHVVFSPDGRLLAAGGHDQIVYVWDVIAGKLAARLEGHQGNVESLAFSPDGRRLVSASRDTTALIWDVSGLAKDPPRRGLLSRKELDELWSTLAGADAVKAYQAILTLESVPDQAVPLLAERLRLQPDNDKRVSRLLALLNSGDFAERERATKELRELGWTAEPALHKALEDQPSLEKRQRAKALLDDIRKQPLPSEMLRMLRGLEVLEHIGTPAARKVIASLAEGTPPARLTREAKAALQRSH